MGTPTLRRMVVRCKSRSLRSARFVTQRATACHSLRATATPALSCAHLWLPPSLVECTLWVSRPCMEAATPHTAWHTARDPGRDLTRCATRLAAQVPLPEPQLELALYYLTVMVLMCHLAFSFSTNFYFRQFLKVIRPNFEKHLGGKWFRRKLAGQLLDEIHEEAVEIIAKEYTYGRDIFYQLKKSLLGAELSYILQTPYEKQLNARF